MNCNIANLAEYINIEVNSKMFKKAFDKVSTAYLATDYNEFGKTKWISYSLEDNVSGEKTKYGDSFKEILSLHRSVHGDIQNRATGFNTSSSVEHPLFVHTDIDNHLKHPNYYNLIIPIYGLAKIEFYQTNSEEIWKPEVNAHGHSYYEEFLPNLKFDREFHRKRKFAEILADKPILLDTRALHGVAIIEAPRVSWCTRWVNIPKEYNFKRFKELVEKVL